MTETVTMDKGLNCSKNGNIHRKTQNSIYDIIGHESATIQRCIPLNQYISLVFQTNSCYAGSPRENLWRSLQQVFTGQMTFVSSNKCQRHWMNTIHITTTTTKAKSSTVLPKKTFGDCTVDSISLSTCIYPLCHLTISFTVVKEQSHRERWHQKRHWQIIKTNQKNDAVRQNRRKLVHNNRNKKTTNIHPWFHVFSSRTCKHQLGTNCTYSK